MKKAQFAAEYLIVVAIGMAVLVPAVYFIYGYTTTQADDVIYTSINDIGNKITDTAEQVYYMGPPSRFTITATMPDKITRMYILENKELVFVVGDKKDEIAFLSNVPLRPNVYSSVEPTIETCTKTCWGKGTKEITVMAMPDNKIAIIIK